MKQPSKENVWDSNQRPLGYKSLKNNGDGSHLKSLKKDMLYTYLPGMSVLLATEDNWTTFVHRNPRK